MRTIFLLTLLCLASQAYTGSPDYFRCTLTDLPALINDIKSAVDSGSADNIPQCVQDGRNAYTDCTGNAIPTCADDILNSIPHFATAIVNRDITQMRSITEDALKATEDCGQPVPDCAKQAVRIVPDVFIGIADKDWDAVTRVSEEGQSAYETCTGRPLDDCPRAVFAFIPDIVSLAKGESPDVLSLVGKISTLMSSCKSSTTFLQFVAKKNLAAPDLGQCMANVQKMMPLAWHAFSTQDFSHMDEIFALGTDIYTTCTGGNASDVPACAKDMASMIPHTIEVWKTHNLAAIMEDLRNWGVAARKCFQPSRRVFQLQAGPDFEACMSNVHQMAPMFANLLKNGDFSHMEEIFAKGTDIYTTCTG